MKEKTPFTQFDLPRVHLSDMGNHYQVPVSTRDAGGEVAILSRQSRGLEVARAAIELLSETHYDDGGFTTQLMAASALNSAWYTYGRDDTVMRRNLPLPVLAEKQDSEVWLQDRAGLGDIAKGNAHQSLRRNNEYMQLRSIYRHDETRRRLLGKSLGITSLSLACLDVVETTQGMSVYEAQAVARGAATKALESARDLGMVIGAYPSMAQIGNEASELMLYVRRKAPQASRELFDDAIERLEAERLLDKR